MRNVRSLLGLTVVAVLAVVGSGSSPLGAQPSPRISSATLTVSPLRVDPGQPVTFTVANCAVKPEVTATETDMVFVVEMTAGPTAGAWHGQLAAGQFDWFVNGTCGDQQLAEIRLDIDNPLIGFQPIGSMIAPSGVPATVYGSDCPDGTVASVRFDQVVFGRGTLTGTPVTAPIDERGDWQVDTPAYTLEAVVPPPGTPDGTVLREFTVNASCGDVTYEVLHIVIQRAVGDDTTTTTLPTAPSTSVPSTPPLAPPADAVPGTSHFTG